MLKLIPALRLCNVFIFVAFMVPNASILCQQQRKISGIITTGCFSMNVSPHHSLIHSYLYILTKKFQSFFHHSMSLNSYPPYSCLCWPKNMLQFFLLLSWEVCCLWRLEWTFHFVAIIRNAYNFLKLWT